MLQITSRVKCEPEDQGDLWSRQHNERMVQHVAVLWFSKSRIFVSSCCTQTSNLQGVETLDLFGCNGDLAPMWLVA